MENPWFLLQFQIILEIKTVLRKLETEEISSDAIMDTLEEPPDSKLGDFSSTICFDLAKKLKKSPRQIAEMILNEIDQTNLPFFSKVEVAGAGYLNFYIKWEAFNNEILQQIIQLQDNFGTLTMGKGYKVVVEHTSPNPTKPIHMGTMRCAVLGDITARLLKKAGYDVEIENYMDDLGRQVAVLTWGKLNIKDEEDYEKKYPNAKGDFKLGLLYTKASQKIEENPKLEEEIHLIQERILTS